MEKVKLKRIEPLTDYEKHFYSYNPKLHKKGWVTWISSNDYDVALDMSKDGDYKSLHPENNKYLMNFDVTKFKKL